MIDIDDILAATLPEDLQDELPTGFNPVGHIGEIATSVRLRGAH